MNVESSPAAVHAGSEAHELLWIEEADAWFEYSEATRHEVGASYVEIESWAWTSLQQRLRSIARRRARLGPAIEAA